MKKLVLSAALALATTASAAAAEPSVNVILIGYDHSIWRQMEERPISDYTRQIYNLVEVGTIEPLSGDVVRAYGSPSGVEPDKTMVDTMASFTGFRAGDTYLCFSIPGGTMLDIRRAKVGGDQCIRIDDLDGAAGVILMVAE